MTVDKYDKLTQAYKKTKLRKTTENVTPDSEGGTLHACEYYDQLTKGDDMMLYDHTALSSQHDTYTDLDQRLGVAEHKNETIEHSLFDTDAMFVNYTKDEQSNEELQRHSDDGSAYSHGDSDDNERVLSDNITNEGAPVVQDGESSSPFMASELAIYNN